MSDPKAYTVGWICAIQTEYVAAQEFLDEEHERLEFQPRGDDNDYTLGRLGKHNVVIAVLPGGEYGLSSATHVATNMVRTFTNVRIGLMVGIAGGAPSSKHDIRLGDVVVSRPGVNHGGVFQFDYGKCIQNRAFESTGHLDKPPSFLRGATSGLEAQYERRGHDLNQKIEQVLASNRRLKDKYGRPDAASDRLYRSDFIHALDGDCGAACKDNPSTLVARPARPEYQDDPMIHYGKIASSNSLMKDATLRDHFAQAGDVLCFEMEAAGLMNNFPCLVIRGICDYSDTHKSKEWQGFAAMMAAAYAKELLYRIAPDQVETERKIIEVLSDVQDTVGRLELGVNVIRSQVHRNEDLEILDWLTKIDYGPAHSDIRGRRQPGTGQWLLNTREHYQKWLEQDKCTLFCPGIAGAGKTILASIVIDDLIQRYSQRQEIGIAYLYCDFRRQHEQGFKDLIASILKQLSQQLPHIPNDVRSLRESYRRYDTRPSLDELSNTLRTMIAGVYSKVFIVVDALDECRASDGNRTKFFQEIFRLQEAHNVNILGTSRDIPEVRSHFEQSHFSVEPLVIRAQEEDILAYLKYNMSSARNFVKKDPVLQHEITHKVAKATGGMFLLAKLHLESVLLKLTERDLLDALEKLSTGSNAYDQAYERTMIRIEEQGRDADDLAKRALQWIVFAKEPLGKEAIQHALAVSPRQHEFDEKCQPDIDDIISVCAGLVIADDARDTITLIHYTTQQYFERTQKHWFTDAQAYITITCITYLTFNHSSRYHRVISGVEFLVRRSYPLLYYAANEWGNHAYSAIHLPPIVFKFLKDAVQLAKCIQTMDAFRGAKKVTGLHLAAYFGLEATVHAMLGAGHDPNVSDSLGRTPLWCAIQKRQEAVVKLLLENGVSANQSTETGPMPLSLAAKSGHFEMVKMILAQPGVDPNAVDSGFLEQGRTPLFWAAIAGHQEVVELLLQQPGVNPNLRDGNGRTPLSFAAEQGHGAVVEMLLKQPGIDPDSRNYGRTREHHKHKDRTPLSYAAAGGHERVVKLLLEREGVNSNSFDHEGWTPLGYAAYIGCEKVVKTFLVHLGVHAYRPITIRHFFYGESTVTPFSQAMKLAKVGEKSHIVELLRSWKKEGRRKEGRDDGDGDGDGDGDDDEGMEMEVEVRSKKRRLL